MENPEAYVETGSSITKQIRIRKTKADKKELPCIVMETSLSNIPASDSCAGLCGHGVEEARRGKATRPGLKQMQVFSL